MDRDELEPRKKKANPKNLEEMSIEALDEYIQDLEAEIARVQKAIDEKKKALSSAESVFKS